MSLKSLLSEEICQELKECKKYQVGSDDYCKTVDGDTKLIDRQIELEKIEIQKEQQKIDCEQNLFANDIQADLLKIDEKDRNVKNILTGTSIIGGLLVGIWGTMEAIKFEEEGSFTSLVGRDFISNLSKLFPKVKS